MSFSQRRELGFTSIKIRGRGRFKNSCKSGALFSTRPLPAD